MAKIIVKDTEVTILSIDEKDYISLTDMVRNIENGLAMIEKWLRNKNTIELPPRRTCCPSAYLLRRTYCPSIKTDFYIMKN